MIYALRRVASFGVALLTFVWLMVCLGTGIGQAIRLWPDSGLYAFLALLLATMVAATGTAMGCLAWQAVWPGEPPRRQEPQGFDVLPPR